MFKLVNPIVGVLLGLTACLPVGGAPGDGLRTDEILDRHAFIPKKRFPPLPGKVIGVLVQCPESALTVEGRESSADQYWFSADGGSYQSVYVVVEKSPTFPQLEAPVGSTGERQLFENLSLATTQTLRARGIRGEAVLVEVEVNGGRGSPPADAFVATKIRRLDGTAEFPARLVRLKARALERYQQWTSLEALRIESELEKALRKALGQRPVTGPREEAEAVYLTWLNKEQRYRIHFLTKITNGAFEYKGGIKIDFSVPGGTQSGATTKVSRSTSLRCGTQAGVEFGRGFQITKDGEFDRIFDLPVQSFQEELNSKVNLGPGVAPSRSPR